MESYLIPDRQNALISKNKEIDKFVDDKSVLDALDTIMYLDTIKSYVPLSQNGEVGELLQKKNISVVHNKADFDYLYSSLMNRIEQLAGKDERVKTYLQNANYQRQTAELPALMSKLERTALKFDVLKEPFKEIMKHVYSMVKDNEIEIDNGKIGLFEKGEGPDIISILNECEYSDAVSVCMVAGYDKKWKSIKQRKLNQFFHFHLSPVCENRIDEKIAEKNTLFGKRKKRIHIKTQELTDVEIEECQYDQEDKEDYPVLITEEDLSSGMFLESLVKHVQSGKIDRKYFSMLMKIMLSVPIIINNHLGNSDKELNTLFSEVQKGLTQEK